MDSRMLGGRYQLEREIGRGGMGSVWLAADRQLHRRVAVKLLPPTHTAAARLREQFEREAQAIARLQHPNVVQIFDFGHDEGTPYIVMELLEGETLSDRLGRQKTMSPAALVPLLQQAARGLGAAHEQGVVHRDLKPANLFLARVGAEEILKLLDFGVAVRTQTPATDAGGPRKRVLTGTPPYISPEQLRGSAAADHRSDLWSLAVVLYRAITGDLPFHAETFGELAVKICTDPPAPPSSRVASLGGEPGAPSSPPIDRFFERALAKDPAQRFQSARELGAAFAEAADPTHARTAVKILYVDDEPDARLLVKQQFRRQIREGLYEFVFAENGADALGELRAHPDVDVVLSDINMPVMDGLTLLGRIPEVNSRAKVIIVSAYDDMTNIRAAMNRGAFDFLVKPIDFTDVAATLAKTVASVREARRTQQSAEENRVLRTYVPQVVVERVLPAVRAIAGGATGAEAAVLWGEARREDATVVVADVRGVVGAGAGDAAWESVPRRLNAVFEVIAPELAVRQGHIERFGGERVIARFSGPGHRERAVEAAVQARAQLASMAERAGAESPYARGVAVGVATGSVVSGTVGSQALSRFEHTLLGEAVNLSAHLCEAARPGEILVDEQLAAIVGGAFVSRAAGRRRVGGVELAVRDVERAAPTAAPSQPSAAASEIYGETGFSASVEETFFVTRDPDEPR